MIKKFILTALVTNHIFATRFTREEILRTTPENLDLIFEYQNIPNKISSEAQRHSDILAYIASMPQKISEIKEKQEAVKACLEQHPDIELLCEGSNINLKSGSCVIKLSSYGNRYRNKLRTVSKESMEQIAKDNEAFKEILEQRGNDAVWYAFHQGILSAEELDQFVRNELTYQTASSLIYYLLAKESNYKQTIAMPETYLLKIDPYKGLDDGNTVILKEFIPDLVQFKEYLKTDPGYFEERPNLLHDLVELIINAVIWDLYDNLMINKENKKLYIVDLEKPNAMTTQESFFNDPQRVQLCVVTGIKQLNQILEEAGFNYQELIVQFAKEKKIEITLS